MEDETATRRVVRVYSFHAEERLPAESDAHILARVLSESETSLDDIKDPWRKFFEPWQLKENDQYSPYNTALYSEEAYKVLRNPITRVLSVEATRLQEQWIQFQDSIPQDERIDTLHSEPSIDGLIKMVAIVSKAWQSKREKGKRGKAAASFHRLCASLDAHSSMLQVVPQGNQYTSLIVGTITSIVKASVNHERIAEELAGALCVISEHIADCEVELELFKTEEMMGAVADLYAHVFLFLSDTLSWHLKKRRRRVLDSFNEKFFDRFEDEIDNIKYKSDAIKRKMGHGSAAEQRFTRIAVEETSRDLRVGLNGVMREQAELKYAAQQLNLQILRDRAERQKERKREAALHNKLVTLLTDAVYSHKLIDPFTSSRSDLANISNIENTVFYDIDAGSDSVSRDDILLESACLEDFFRRDRVCLPSDRFAATMVDPEALARLSEWAASDDSQTLHLAGPDFRSDELNNPTSSLAAKFIDLATQSRVPVVSFSCQLRRDTKNDVGCTREMRGFIELVYALIRQLIELLPPQLKQSDMIFWNRRFQRLDGTETSLEEALEMLKHLYQRVPRKVFCVIDGIQWLDDKSTSAVLAQLIQSLQDGRMKILFTTTGHSRALLHILSRRDLCILHETRERGGGPSGALEGLVRF